MTPDQSTNIDLHPTITSFIQKITPGHDYKFSYPLRARHDLKQRIVCTNDLAVFLLDGQYYIEGAATAKAVETGEKSAPVLLDGAKLSGAVFDVGPRDIFPILINSIAHKDKYYFVVLFAAANTDRFMFARLFDATGAFLEEKPLDSGQKRTLCHKLKDRHLCFAFRHRFVSSDSFETEEMREAISRHLQYADPYNESAQLESSLPHTESLPFNPKSISGHFEALTELAHFRTALVKKKLEDVIDLEAAATDLIASQSKSDIAEFIRASTWLNLDPRNRAIIDIIDWQNIDFKFLDLATLEGQYAIAESQIRHQFVVYIDLKKYSVSHIVFGNRQSALNNRQLTSLFYILRIISENPAVIHKYAKELGHSPDRFVHFTVHCGDRFAGPFVGYNAEIHIKDNLLIPDSYFLRERGYDKTAGRFNYDDMPFESRLPKAFWRGSTTGTPNLKLPYKSIEDFLTLPRVWLCQLSNRIPDLLDAKITNITQGTKDSTDAFRQYCGEHQLMAGRAGYDVFAQHRYVLDVDGNSNSWGLLERLMLGSCILKVKSTYKQWFYDDLVAGETHIEINEDLSNLEDEILRLNKNPDEAKRIAQNGVDFAIQRSFARECQTTVRNMLEFAKAGTPNA